MTDWREEYEAQVTESHTPIGWVKHLRVRRRDGRDGISWDTLQQIKNELLDPEALVVEFYPRQSRMVNEVNMRHLWEVPDYLLPFGLFNGEA